MVWSTLLQRRNSCKGRSLCSRRNLASSIFLIKLGKQENRCEEEYLLNFLPLVEEMTSCGTPRGMHAHPAAAERVRLICWGTCFLPSLVAKSIPKRAICLCLGFSLSVPDSHSLFPETFWSIANSFFPSLINFAANFSSFCLAVLLHLTTSMLALPFLWGSLQVSSLTFIPSSFLPSLSDSRLFFHLEKRSQPLLKTWSLGCLWLGCYAY